LRSDILDVLFAVRGGIGMTFFFTTAIVRLSPCLQLTIRLW
jgi:hypothetical protein